MMLIVLDEDPAIAKMLLPKSIRHKQLLELMQMLSCIVGFGYEKLPNGKAIKEWICKNKNGLTIMQLTYLKILLKILRTLRKRQQ